MIDVKEYNLGDSVEFLEYANEAQWHELRKKGIGGSDAGAVMGLNKYTTPLKLYRTKIGEYKEDQEDNVYIKKGKDLEGVVFEKYVTPDMASKGYTALHPEHIFVNKQYPWLRANCDGLAVPLIGTPADNVVIEIKWVSEYAEVNWDGDEYCGIPASYYAQVQHYMIVTGARKSRLYALFDRTWDVKIYDIPFNPSFALKLISETKQFYDNLQAGIEPKISASKDKEFMPEALEGAPKVQTVDETLDPIVGEYLTMKAECDALEKQMQENYDKIIAAYLEGKVPSKMFKVTVSSCKRAGFDSKRFAADHPAAYEAYKTEVPYSRTVIKKV